MIKELNGMPSKIEETFEDLLKNYPDFLKVSDLVKMGLFPSKCSVYKAKERDDIPPFIQISERKLRFPKNSLVCWLKARQGQLAHIA